MWAVGKWTLGVLVLSGLAGACSSDSKSATSPSGGSAGQSGGPIGGSAQQGGSAGQAGAAAAAGSGGSSAGTASLPTTPYDACVAYLNAQCNRVQRECGGREPLEDPCPYATDLCPDFLFAEGSSFDVASALACAATFRTFDCDKLNRGIYPDCVSLPGKHALGEACWGNHQCASSACGHGTDPLHPQCGQCVPIGKQGDPCADGSFGCPNGYECTGEGCQPQTLVFNLPSGAPCERYGQCAGDAYCFPALDGSMRCQTPLELGAPCAQGAQCNGGACVDGQCQVVNYDYANVGESCFAAACTPEAWCSASGDMNGKCMARVAAGEVCQLDPGLSAETRGNCNSTELSCQCEGPGCVRHCVKPAHVGEACNSALSACVAGTHCDGVKCVGTDSQGLYETTCGK